MKTLNKQTSDVLALATAFVDSSSTKKNNYVLSIYKDKYLYFAKPFDNTKVTIDDCNFLQLFCSSKGFFADFSTL